MNASSFGILIVDDEPNIRAGLQKGLAKEADVIHTAGDATEAMTVFQSSQFQMVIVDVRLPGDMDGLRLIERLLKIQPQTTAIVITAHGTVETAVEAMRIGAFDFISKPIDLNLIRQQVRKAREHHQLRIENHELRDRLAHAGDISGIVGNSSAIQQVMQQVRQVAKTDATVMIQGESGTGKELVAKAVHDLSDRCHKPFVAVNLGALPETLLESELFGHEKGSFTGAARQKPGCFEQAKGGSLFLDEITEIPAKCQVDLLRVLETGQYTRIGGENVLTSDVRIISAANKSPETEIEEGNFREDLYYRLNIIPIKIPPLRDRRDDIPLLAEHFLDHFCSRHHRDFKLINSDAMHQLTSASWPGNVRQLRNVIERLVVTTTGETICAADIPSELNQDQTQLATTAPATLAAVVEDAEKRAIAAALKACDHHREQTASMLGVSVRTLHYKMNRYDLHE